MRVIVDCYTPSDRRAGGFIHLITQNRSMEKAILSGSVSRGMTRVQEQDSLEELALLAETAGAVVVDRIIQERREVDPATFIGKGKVHHLARRVSETGADLVIFDADLSPVQVKNLESHIKCKIVDRSGLILDIFARRARSREAQIQVELAQLQYLLPRLTRRWTHLSRQEAGIGTRGPGETQLEVDRRAIRRRIGHLKDDLHKIERQRRLRRKGRVGFYKVALVGYTNVGKSSLLNALADADAFVEDRLFATLDATIRAMPHSEDRILLIDTVGFIRHLPPHLIASFRSTLEEAQEADLLLHVVDVSHPGFEEQIGTVHSVLRDLDIDRLPTITVFNKVDLLEDRRLFKDLTQRFVSVAFTSALKGIGLETLRLEIVRLLKEDEVEDEIRVPSEDSRTIAAIHRMARVVHKEYEDGVTTLRFWAKPMDLKRIHSLIDHQTTGFASGSRS